VLLLASTAGAAPPRPEVRCAGAKLEGTGKATRAALTCEGEQAGAGLFAGPCEGELDGIEQAFAAAESRGVCETAGDTSGVRGLAADLLASLREALRPSTAASRCARAKLGAAGRLGHASLACTARAWGKGPGVEVACLDRARSRLASAFRKAEGRHECLTTDDAASVEGLVDTFVADVVGLIGSAPVGLAASVDGNAVLATWTAPDPSSGHTQVRLLRGLNAPPTGPDDPLATLLYAGPATSFRDPLTGLLPDTPEVPRTYHYAVFGCPSIGSCEAMGSHATVTPTLAQALRAGGYVLYWRHPSATVCIDRTDLGTAASTTYPDWWKRCDAACSPPDPVTATARQLSATGVAQATAIGEFFRDQAIPVGRVLSSEFCRCVTAAELMNLGPAIEQDPGITFFVHDEPNRCAHALARVAEPPAPDTDTAVIGHAGFTCPILDSLAMGEAAVYRPDGAGGADYITRVPSDAWHP
jgi:phosphohistidine phosphatase SixA